MAHPTGRMIGSREPSPFDMERVLERAAELGVAMEINSQPDRLDLKDAHARLAREKGVRMVIDTDAHSVGQLDFMRYGVFTARRAGLTKGDVLNTLPHERFMERLRRPGRDGARPAGRAGDTAGAAGAKPTPTRIPEVSRPKRKPARRTAKKRSGRAGAKASGGARAGARSTKRGKKR
jgi:DNA polymerase (family 10)